MKGSRPVVLLRARETFVTTRRRLTEIIEALTASMSCRRTARSCTAAFEMACSVQ